MPKYKLSPEESGRKKKERKENLRNIMKGLNVKNFDDLKDAFKRYSKKTLKTSFGETAIKVAIDRNGEFEPQLVKKNQTSLTEDIEEKILSMYAKGMTTSDTESHIQEIYGLECSDTTISRITDKILPVVREWQARQLDEIYAVVFMDAIHFHIRSEEQVKY